MNIDVQPRDGRNPDKHYVHLYSAVWPEYARPGDAKRAFVDTLTIKNDVIENVSSLLSWIEQENIQAIVVYKLSKTHISYYMEFDLQENAIEAKLSF